MNFWPVAGYINWPTLVILLFVLRISHIIHLTIGNIPTVNSSHETSSDWLLTYNGSNVFRQSVFFKGPVLLAITETNLNITCLPSLFSINIYKSNAKRVLLEHQSTGNNEESWQTFLLRPLRLITEGGGGG